MCPRRDTISRLSGKRLGIVGVISAILVVLFLLSSSFMPLSNISNEALGDDQTTSNYVQDLDSTAKSSASTHFKSWDWSGFADAQGYVDVIVSYSDDGDGIRNDRAQDLLQKLGTGKKEQFSKAFNGFSSRVSLELLSEYEQASATSITVYPDFKVNATVDPNMISIGADQVWSRTDSSGRPVMGYGVVVAVIDTGVDYLHPDLGGGIGPSYKVIGGYDFYNGDDDPMDDNGHGTHVAGIIAANGGMSGVAPEASILAYKVLGSDGGGSMSDVISAIERSMDPNRDGNTADHADVISMSLGGKGQSDDPVCQAVASATSAGIVVVVAAGNDGPSMGTVASPGLAPDAVTVGAVDNYGVLASFSSRGTSPELSIKPEISAPGVQITSTVPYSGTPHSSPTGYAPMSGTSMATPHVSGGAALLLQMHPSWTPAQIKSALVSGASRLNESIWSAGSGGLWLPKAIDSRLFFSPSLVSYGLAGSASSAVTVTNAGSSVSLTFTSKDFCELSADGTLGDAIWTNISSVSPGSYSLQPGGSMTSTLNVPKVTSSIPEGYFDGEVRVSGTSVDTRIPFGFAVLSRLNVHVLNAAGNEVYDPYGGVWVFDYPSATVAVGVRGSSDKPAPPASFLLPSGNYSAHSMGHQLIYEFSDPYVLSSKFTLKKLETKDVYLNMSGAHAFTIDLATDAGLPIFVKDYRVYGRHVGERNISFHLVGSDYSVEGSEVFSVPSSKTVYISDTDIRIGLSISGFSYTPAMWDFMQRNWQHWYEYSSSDSNVFYPESSTDLQYLMAWEFDGITSATSTSLGLVPGQYSVYDTKYDIPGQLEDIWGDWGNHRSIGGDSAFYIRRDTDTSLNSFFSGMTRRTIVQGVFTEIYFPGDLFQGFIERKYYSPDYSHTVKVDMASEVYLPDRNFLVPLDATAVSQRLGTGPFHPALRTEISSNSMVIYHPLLEDQSGSKVGSMSLPTMYLYRSGQLTGIYQLSEHLARPDAKRVVGLSQSGVYTAKIDLTPVPQICGNVNIELGFTVPAIDSNPPVIEGLVMSQRFVPGDQVPITVQVTDGTSTPAVQISWRPSSTSSWTSLSVTPLGGSSYGASIQTTAATSKIDIMVKGTDGVGNYLLYTASNASAKQVPVLFDIASSSNEVGYRNGDASLVLTGALTDTSGNPLHPSAGVPLEMTVGGTKVGMLLDEYMGTSSHAHNGTIKFEWHFNPTYIFSGPNETVNIDVAFDLGTYQPIHSTIALTSVGYYNPAPQIILQSPPDGSVIPAGQMIDFEITDDGAVQVDMRLDGASYGTLQSPWDVSTDKWTDGTHVLQLTATDDQLVTTVSSFTFHVDKVNPVVKILEPLQGSSVPTGWVLRAEVTDDHLDLAMYSVDGGASQAFYSPYTIDMTGWSIGIHNVSIEARDLAGHVTTNSTEFEIVTGTLALNIVSPANGGVIRSGVPIEFQVLSRGTFTSSWNEGGTWHSLGSSTSISTSGWFEGLHTITINSTDDLGGWDQHDITITIDDTLPFISLVSPVNQSFVSPADTVVVMITDDNFESAGWTLWGQARTSSSPDLSIALSGSQGDGPFTVDVRALDKAGNEGRSSFGFSMDSRAPSLYVQGLQTGDAIYLGQILTVVAQDTYLSYVRWSVDSSTETTLMAPYEVDSGNLSSGWHAFRFAAGDYSGKSSMLNMSLYIDTTAPTVVPSFPASVPGSSAFNLSANITDDYHVAKADLYYEQKDGSFASLAMYGQGSMFRVQVLRSIQTWDGMTVYIRACDSVGNWAESQHIELGVSSTPGGTGTPDTGDEPGSGDFSIVSWLSTVEGMAVIGISLGLLFVAAAFYRKSKRDDDDITIAEVRSRHAPRTDLKPQAYVPKAWSPLTDTSLPIDVPVAKPAEKEYKRVLKVDTMTKAQTPAPAQRASSATLLDAIPSAPMKEPPASDGDSGEEIDYGDLIERELIIPGLKRSVFQDDLKELEHELGLDVDPKDPSKRVPKPPQNPLQQ